MEIDIDADGLAWVDAVPAGRARAKRVVVREHEWSATTPTPDGRRRLTAHFWINSTELVAILVEDTSTGHGGTRQTTGAPQPRLRLAGRSYLLYVEAPAQTPAV